MSAGLPVRVKRRLPSRAERRFTFAVKVLATFALAVYLLQAALGFFGAIRTTGLLVVAAVFLAYLVYPLLRLLRSRMPLVAALLLVYLVVGVAVATAAAWIVPALARDVEGFARSLPAIVDRLHDELLSPSIPLVQRVPLEDRTYLANLPSQFGALAKTYGLDTLQKGLAVLLSAFSVIGALVIVPVLAAYLMLEAETIREHVLGFVPQRLHARADALLVDLGGAIGGFIRGQLIDGAIVGVTIFAMLLVLHVPYSLLIGVSAGILNFIPYAGAIVGFIPSVLLALAYNGPGNAGIVAAMFVVIQQIDGHFVAPRVLRDSVGLSPVYIILAILTGTELFGLPGTLLAVPVAAMLRVLREHLLPTSPVTKAAE